MMDGIAPLIVAVLNIDCTSVKITKAVHARRMDSLCKKDVGDVDFVLKQMPE
jgi:hypothetical protein